MATIGQPTQVERVESLCDQLMATRQALQDVIREVCIARQQVESVLGKDTDKLLPLGSLLEISAFLEEAEGLARQLLKAVRSSSIEEQQRGSIQWLRVLTTMAELTRTADVIWRAVGACSSLFRDR